MQDLRNSGLPYTVIEGHGLMGKAQAAEPLYIDEKAISKREPYNLQGIFETNP
jgi:hypothetical protein